jgi:hypothetical protein
MSRDKMEEKRQEAIGRIRLPMTEILHISVRNIKIRFTRSLLSLSSVILGIAFLVTLLITTLVFQIYSEKAGVAIPLASNQVWLVAISLLVCAVSIANSVLIAVYERYKEIGTMKCLGALDRHIFLLFITESSLIGLLGGVIGFAVGTALGLLSYGMRFGFDVVTSIPLVAMLIVFAFSITMSVVISVVATLYPAYKASKSNPVEALRFEI